MGKLKLLGAAALAAAVTGFTAGGTAEAQTTKAGIKKSGAAVTAPVKGKRVYSSRPAHRVYYSRPPRVVG